MEIKIGDRVFDSTKKNVNIVMSRIEREWLMRLLKENEPKDSQLLEISIKNIP